MDSTSACYVNSPWNQYHLQPIHRVGSRTAFFSTCYPLLLIVQGIDLPLGIEKMKCICPDNLRDQE